MGPAQGVHTSPSAAPSSSPLLVSTLLPMLPIPYVKRANQSENFGKISIKPKTAMIAMLTNLKIFGSMPSNLTIVVRNNVKNEKLTTRPIMIARECFLLPDNPADKMAGRTGSTQGESAVAKPARNEKSISKSMSVFHYTQPGPLLSQIDDPPKRLYVRGKLPDFSKPMIAVVGTRHVTDYGRKVTYSLARDLATAGFTIVSGFMYGVDAIAHGAAIDAGGKTIGVLGFGFDYMYPKSHASLAKRMLETGNTLVTEFEPEVPAMPQNFPRRNRIVSGLCLGVVVTEAAKNSGSMITARLAVEQGREVFAVPGPIDSLYSEGTKELINLGAKLVTNVSDIVDELVQ